VTPDLFFAALYSDQTGILELRTFGPEDSDQSVKAQHQRKAANRLRDFVPVYDGVFDSARIQRFLDGCARAELGAFFGVALRTMSAAKHRKGDAEHCHLLTALFVDADFKEMTEDYIRTELAKYSTPPSIVVNSGGGLHPYWLLRQPLDLQVDYEGAREVLRSLAYTVACVRDVSVSEPARILRIPGSLNFKYDPPRLVTIEQFSDARIDRADLFLIEMSPLSGNEGASFRVPEEIAASSKERHETLRKLLRSLQSHGVPLDAIVKVCKMENVAKCRPPLPDAEVQSYLERVSQYKDRAGFERNPKAGWELARKLVALELSVEAVLVAVRSVTPDFDPNVPEPEPIPDVEPVGSDVERLRAVDLNADWTGRV
jgi:hypothetical protein